MKNIFQMNLIGRNNRLWSKISFFALAITYIPLFLEWTSAFVVLLGLSLALIILIKVIDKQENGWDIGTAILSIPLLFYQYLLIENGEPILKWFSPLAIIL